MYPTLYKIENSIIRKVFENKYLFIVSGQLCNLREKKDIRRRSLKITKSLVGRINPKRFLLFWRLSNRYFKLSCAHVTSCQ